MYPSKFIRLIVGSASKYKITLIYWSNLWELLHILLVLTITYLIGASQEWTSIGYGVTAVVSLIRAVTFTSQKSLFQLTHIQIINISLCLLLIIAVHTNELSDILHCHIHGSTHHIHFPSSRMHFNTRFPFNLLVHECGRRIALRTTWIKHTNYSTHLLENIMYKKSDIRLLIYIYFTPIINLYMCVF